MSSALTSRQAPADTALDRPVKYALLAALATSLLLTVGGFLLIAVWWPQRLVADGSLLLTVAVPVLVAQRALRRHFRRARRLGLLAAAGVGLVLGLLPWAVIGAANPTFAALQHAVDQVHLPSAFSTVASERSGDRRCHDGCPTIALTYRTGGLSQDEAVQAIRLAYGRRGWRADQGDASSLYRGALHAQVLAAGRGEVQVTVGHDDASHGDLIPITPSAATGP